LDTLSIAAYAAIFFLMLFLGARRPGLGVAGLIAVDPFSYDHIVYATTITLPKTALVGMLLGLLLRRKSLRPLFGRAARPLCFGALAIALATALSVLQAEHLAEALRETLKAFEYLATFGAVVLAIRDDPDERCVRRAFALTAALVGILACAQLFTGAPSALLYAHHPIPRVAGPIEGPNQLSGYLDVTLPVVAAFALLRTPLYAELPALGIGVVALLLTLSRAGVVTTLGAVALTILIAPSRCKRGVSLIVAAATFVGLGAISLTGYVVAHDFGILWRFSSTDESEVPGSVGTRSALWRAAITLWRMHPQLGIGAGNFELEVSKVGLKGVKTHANSLYLQSLVEGGLPLLAAQLHTVAASVATFTRASLREPLILGALAASTGLALHQVVDFLVFYPKVGSIWWIVLALGVAASGREEPDRRSSSSTCCAV
jgi:O-antigen ligase